MHDVQKKLQRLLESKDGGVMGRLTVKEPTMGYYYSGYSTSDIINKLAEYEDLEEQGLLLKLPCKVGDKIYHIEDGNIYEFKTTFIEVRRENGEYIFCIAFMDYKAEDFGKIVFLTKEEAEEALRKKVE